MFNYYNTLRTCALLEKASIVFQNILQVGLKLIACSVLSKCLCLNRICFNNNQSHHNLFF